MLTVIDDFGAARLLVFDHDPATREPTVEVAHETLLRAWPRLRTWLDDDREDLRALNGVGAATESWIASDRDEGELARGGRLEIISDLADRRAETLNDAESEWVRASQAAAAAAEQARTDAAERDRRQNRRLRAMLVAAAVFVVIAVIAAGVAVVQRNRAADSERVAAASQGAALSAQAEALAADEVASAAATAEAAAESSAQVDRLMGLSARQIRHSPTSQPCSRSRRTDAATTSGPSSPKQTVLANLRGVSNVSSNPLEGNTATHVLRRRDPRDHVVVRLRHFRLVRPDDRRACWGAVHRRRRCWAALSSGDGSVIAYILADDRDRITVDRRNGDEMSTVLAVDGELWAWALDHSGETLAFVPAGSSGYTQILDVGSGQRDLGVPNTRRSCPDPSGRRGAVRGRLVANRYEHRRIRCHRRRDRGAAGAIPARRVRDRWCGYRRRSHRHGVLRRIVVGDHPVDIAQTGRRAAIPRPRRSD